MYSLHKRRRVSHPSQQDPILVTHQTNGLTAGLESPWGSHVVWSTLAPEILVHIFTYLTSPGDRRSSMSVCRSWKEAMNAQPLWKESVVCIKRTISVPPSHWTIPQIRGIRKFILRGNLAIVLLLLSRLEEYSPELVSLQLEITESFHFTLKAGKELVSALLKFSCLRVVGLVGNGQQEYGSIELMLQELHDLQDLRLVGISNIPLRVQAVSHRKLKSLQLQQIASLTCAQTTALVNLLPNMECLLIQACSFEVTFLNTSAVKKKGCSSVLKLSLANTVFDGDEVRVPFRFKFLEFLDLSSCRQTEQQLVTLLEQFNDLKGLNLSGNECTDTVLQKLLCPLRSLELKRCVKVTERGVRGLVEICGDSLEQLNLAHCTGVDVSLVASLPRLFPEVMQLDLSGWTALTAPILKHLQSAQSLRKLVLQAIPHSQRLKRILDKISMQSRSRIVVVC